mgnify:CR=1 FL=1
MRRPAARAVRSGKRAAMSAARRARPSVDASFPSAARARGAAHRALRRSPRADRGAVARAAFRHRYCGADDQARGRRGRVRAESERHRDQHRQRRRESMGPEDSGVPSTIGHTYDLRRICRRAGHRYGLSARTVKTRRGHHPFTFSRRASRCRAVANGSQPAESNGRACFRAVLHGLQLGTTFPLVDLPPRMIGTR